MKKVKKDLWEEMLVYPSFNIRFTFTLTCVLVVFSVLTYILLFKLGIANNISEKVSMLNLIIQGATLVLGIFAAYYALRQLVETRFTSLDQAGMRELRDKRYLRALNKWKEAFYIRAETNVFTNLNETLLLVGDYDTFDQYIKLSEHRTFLKQELFQETSDQIVLLYLKSIRHLLVKNQGEAEKFLSELVTLNSEKNALTNFRWEFVDLVTSDAYQALTGECKNIAENLISYLSKTITPTRKSEFEAKNFSSQAP